MPTSTIATVTIDSNSTALYPSSYVDTYYQTSARFPCQYDDCSLCRPASSSLNDVPAETPLPPVRPRARRSTSLYRDTNDERVGVNNPNCACETCKLRRFGYSKISRSFIESYSARPDKYTFFRSQNDVFDYYLGVELETSNNRGLVLPEYAADMRRPHDFWLPKSDSSVSGPEFASHPATLTWWREHSDDLAEMFQMLLHAGYSSHNGNTCGMHINISRNAFESPRHLFRFLTLLHRSPRWAIRMSQRTVGAVESWASLASRRQALVNVANGFRTDKYVALNNPNGSYPPYLGRVERSAYAKKFTKRSQASRAKGRYEFRLPRGTLRLDRFYKNLEWTVGMIEYTRGHSIPVCNPKKFMDWVAENSSEFPYLNAFILEKIRSDN